MRILNAIETQSSIYVKDSQEQCNSNSYKVVVVDVHGSIKIFPMRSSARAMYII